MFTKKSLIIGLALLLAVICAGSAGAFASSVTPAAQQDAFDLYPTDGVSAIPVDNPDGMLTSRDVWHYLNTEGSVAGQTVDGQPPTIQAVGLTDVAHLRSLLNLVIPDAIPDRQVYYSQIKGPFTLDQNIPLPLLSTLLPSSNNLPVLNNLPIFNQLPDLTSLPLLQSHNSGGGIVVGDVLPVIPNPALLNSLLNNAIVLGSDSGPGNPPGPATTNSPDSPTPSDLLATIYEVFDAHSGNLLAWG